MSNSLKKLDKILVANRGEIAVRILRAASELKIRTVAMYTYEDRYSLHRYKADESYQLGEDSDPLKPYLDIEGIIKLAKDHDVDAIHPGYGFLSENLQFAKRCREEGLIFVGPSIDAMAQMGDKIASKELAIKAGVPIIQDSQKDLVSIDIARTEAERIGYPVMLKAAAGGGGRGMRVLRNKEDLEMLFQAARNEAEKFFSDDTVFLEKFIDQPKHIEVQLLGDEHGNLVHLYERDCSVQRRFQKVVEVAPSPNLKQETKDAIYDYAVKLGKLVNYSCAGTVEFLVDREENIFFIEVNPRVQVEHTITEEITGIDIVRSQILIAKGHKLSDPVIYIRDQSDVECNGFAIQCRITTENPEENFKPDYGTIIAYRNAGGFGIRLDEGSTYAGMKISPFFDSMLVKVSAWGRTLNGASERLYRSLTEFRIRGVKTNIGFLENVITHEVFKKGDCTVNFIGDHPELFKTKRVLDRGTKTLKYLANVSVNGLPEIKFVDPTKILVTPTVPSFDKYAEYPKGTKDKLNELGRDGFVQWLKNEKQIHYTDTTFRDAHQSLLATRVRSRDILSITESYAKNNPQIFSAEVWGGATFDVALRFLHECPWKRLQDMRKTMPNILLQMLFRGSNGVGYKAYPDNLIEKFIEKAAENGVDIFRIFDSLNWMDAMKTSIKAVRENTNSLAEVALCYTGDITDPSKTKYNLQYYVDLAKQIEDAGAHILCIKDMAGLLKPRAAELLIPALKEAIDIPIHLHTHDTSAIQVSTYFRAIESGVDVIDCAISSMSGLTSQPSLNGMAALMKGHERENPLNLESLNEFATYWEDRRDFYYPFESGLKAGTAQVYDNEIPGGQYSNLKPQAASVGLIGQDFERVKKNYAVVNKMFGDIVKVTPSSKVVGDMAIFMTSSNLTPEDVMNPENNISFPESVKEMFRGDLGQPYGGFPQALSKIILKDEKPYTNLPNEHLKPVDFEVEFAQFQKDFEYCDFLDFLSYKLYPAVFKDYYNHNLTYGYVNDIPTRAFFYGMTKGQEILVPIATGKTIMIKMLYILEPDENGMSTVGFELNGQTRRIQVKNTSVKATKIANRKAIKGNVSEVGSPLQGKLSSMAVKIGQKVEENDPLFIIEAMKMETTIASARSGRIKAVYLPEGVMVDQEDLVIEFEG
jgi:pyruvate carboxylase